MVAGGQAATRTTQAPVLLPDRKETKPAGPEVRIFRLFNKNTNMREERASVILLFAMHNEPIPLKEVGHVSGIASERLRSLVNRLRKEGWLERSGRGKYQMGKFAITDLGMLIGAVKAGNEEAATTVAATMQDPLPGLGAKWVNHEMWAVRRSLRAAAVECWRWLAKGGPTTRYFHWPSRQSQEKATRSRPDPEADVPEGEICGVEGRWGAWGQPEMGARNSGARPASPWGPA